MYCRNCGKPISSIATECPYCNTKVNENIEADKQVNPPSSNNSGLNKNLYNGMNGKPVTLWKFILGIILLGGGIFIALMSVL